jgi:triphosphoribosyl-dephospho-CoA synthase
MDRREIEKAVMASFVGEIEAFKPGNVSVYADGHNMSVRDFIVSAEVSVPFLCQTDSNLGQRILQSVIATRDAVACNTNLGMLLLFAPIIIAAESEFDDVGQLRQNLETTLSSLTQEDADQVFEAIRIAKPGGLGSADTQDVNNKPNCSLIDAMRLARKRDSIALQYTNNFTEIFELGFETIKHFDKCWNSVKWSTVSCYMKFMSTIADSHIKRKYGESTAEQIRKDSEIIAGKFQEVVDPELLLSEIESFDKELKARDYNPGTSADLAAASLLVYNLTIKQNL